MLVCFDCFTSQAVIYETSRPFDSVPDAFRLMVSEKKSGVLTIDELFPTLLDAENRLRDLFLCVKKVA